MSKTKFSKKLFLTWMLSVLCFSVLSTNLSFAMVGSVPDENWKQNKSIMPNIENNDILDSEKLMEDDQILEKDKEFLDAKDLNLKFETFNSCKNMDEVIDDFVSKMPVRNNIRPGVMYKQDMVSESLSPDFEDSSNMEWSSSSSEFSNTNLQKENVDEPEIFKTDGKNLYYYNNKEKKIYIFSSPLNTDTSKFDLNNAKVIKTINIPKNFENVKLFLQSQKMIIIANRYTDKPTAPSIINRNTKTVVIIYDIKNISNAKLIKMDYIDGNYNDSRIVDGKLFVMSNINIDRWYMDQNSEKKTNISKNLPKNIEITRNNGKNTRMTLTPKCEQIEYILPDEDTIKGLNLYPNFVFVNTIDISDTNKNTSQKLILWENSQIHFSSKSLYITQNIRFNNYYNCPWMARCIMPRRDIWSQTLIHKFDLIDSNLKYNNSNLISGQPINQYSMDEDDNWNFRILTRKNRSEGTNFSVLDDNLVLKWKIDWIEPWEQFKSSRYIWDKLYLVTFEQTDPLFVIDIADISKPKIIGELVIPWYSTYLHQMWKLTNNKQYLIWLWYDVSTNQRGGVVNSGVKLDLYEIDYSKKQYWTDHCNVFDSKSEIYKKCITKAKDGYVSIKQLASKSMWWQWSYSESLDNPRMFVMNSENVVTMPLMLRNQIKNWQNCNTLILPDGTEKRQNCYDITKNTTDFVWLKSFKFDVNNWINEVNSINYKSTFEKLYKSNNEYEDLEYRQIQNTDMRVGFLGDITYMLNNDFAHFFNSKNTSQQKYININKLIDMKIDNNSNKETLCKNAGGERLSSSNECEWISKNTCESAGGKFNECASACRNNPSAEMCTMQCIIVCQF